MAERKPYDLTGATHWTREGRITNHSMHTAPELLRNGEPREKYCYNHAVDIWALGIVICELQISKVSIACLYLHLIRLKARPLPGTADHIRDSESRDGEELCSRGTKSSRL